MLNTTSFLHLLRDCYQGEGGWSQNNVSQIANVGMCRGSKPAPPERGQVADLPLYAALFQDECSLYLDMSGDSLHRRGYRSAMHASSLNESAAAGVLSLANWSLTSSSAGAPPIGICPHGTQELGCFHSAAYV